MIVKLFEILRMIGYKIIFGKRLQCKWPSCCERHSKIVIKSGVLNIGTSFHMRAGSYISVVKGGNASVGNGVFINRNCSIVCQESIIIGNNCALGPSVVLYDHDHRFGTQGLTEGYKTAPIVIEDNCWIGAGAIILRGTRIGEGSVIGAGTVIKGDIPPHSLVKLQSDRALTVTPIEER